MDLQLDKPLVFFDLETTGVSVTKDRIVELYALRINVDGSRDEKLQRFNPGMPIPAGASAVHGIYDNDVADAPTFVALSADLAAFFEGCDLAGYNALRFDIPLLAEEFIRAGITQPFQHARFVDPMVIFHRMVPRTLSGALRYYRNEELENAHTAKADVLATVKVLESQLKVHDELPNSTEAIHHFVMNGREIVDYAGYFIKDMSGDVVFNFGKHKGKPIASEPGYLKWMLEGDFAQHTKLIAQEYLKDQPI